MLKGSSTCLFAEYGQLGAIQGKLPYAGVVDIIFFASAYVSLLSRRLRQQNVAILLHSIPIDVTRRERDQAFLLAIYCGLHGCVVQARQDRNVRG